MPNIVHRIGVDKTTPEHAYQGVVTRDGIAAWWTEQVHGDSKVGTVLQFRFAEGGPDFEVLELTPFSRVRWKCAAGPPEWLDTNSLRYQWPGWRNGYYL